MAIHSASPMTLLIVDDEELALLSYATLLRSRGIRNVETVSDSRKAVALLEKTDAEVLLLDLMMPHLSGQEILQTVANRFPWVAVIIITGADDVETAVDCMRCGAFDYLLKPVDRHRLVTSVERAIRFRELERENTRLKEQVWPTEIEQPEAFAHIITRNDKMLQLFHYAEAVSTSTRPVLITGETGVGKELIARAIHTASGRKGAFVAVNTAGLDDTVFSDTLFGHCAGAFTGASHQRKGLVEQAAEGTLFLDEIGDLAQETQIKLLRLIQEGEYYPLGSDTPHSVATRIVTATNRNLKAERDRRTFRKDLYYRLNVHHIHLPPLRDRKEDLPQLLDHFLEEACKEMHKTRPSIPGELPTLLDVHPFPGNVRELEAMVYDAVGNHPGGTLSLHCFNKRIFPENGAPGRPPHSLTPEAGPEGIRFPSPLPSLQETTALLMQEALGRSDNNQTLAARLLGISRQTLNRHLRKSFS